MEKLPIIEIYPCIQGEGKYVGVPHILIRFTGCNLRCCFNNSSCDTPYTSYNPEKGKFTLEEILIFISKFPQIKHILLTGGEPTLYSNILFGLIKELKKLDKFITVESAGSVFLKDWYNDCIDFLSLSPKLANSIPEHKEYKEIHEKNRKNYEAMFKLISCSKDYQVKFVISGEKEKSEIKFVQSKLNIPNNKIWLMPTGVNNKQLEILRKNLVEICIKEGWNYSDRLHVIIYGNKRGV